jgi:hypothetical protein
VGGSTARHRLDPPRRLLVHMNKTAVPFTVIEFLTNAGDVNVLAGEEEEVHSDAGLGKGLASLAIVWILWCKEGLLLVRSIQFRILAMLQRTGANSREG